MEGGRAVYPRGEGVIWQAFNHQKFEELGLPDPVTDPEDYHQWHAKYGVCRETVDGFNMKSRAYLAYWARDPLDMNTAGVVVFESTDPLFPAAGAIRLAVGNGCVRSLEAQLQFIREYGPSLVDSGEKGF
jgi:hypothetical protein